MSRGETLLLLPAQRCLDLLPLRLPMGSTRRILFGRPEPSIKAIAEALSEERERMIERWDFDPATDKPVVPPKRYPWEAVVPEGERISPADAAPSPGRNNSEARRRNRVTPYKQLRITDFWRMRKLESSKTATSEQSRASLDESGMRE